MNGICWLECHGVFREKNENCFSAIEQAAVCFQVVYFEEPVFLADI